MIRLTAILLLLLGMGAYTVLHPTAGEQVTRPSGQALLGSIGSRQSHPARIDTPPQLPLLPNVAGQRPTFPVALVVQPGSAVNPPRSIAHSAQPRGTTSAILHLPKVLPVRTVVVPILMYHHISSTIAAPSQVGLTVSDSDFAAQLEYLRQHGYHTVLLRRVFAALYTHAALPPHPIVLSFDDGYRDNYTDALPILRHYQDVAEFNVITAYPGITLGVNTYMTWKQIKTLVKDGMEIGSHTIDHQDLGLMSEDHLRYELRDSRNVLQQKLHVPVQFIAYPSGEPFKDGSPAAQQLLLTLLPEYGYVGGLLDSAEQTSVQNAQQPYQLNRIRVSNGEPIGTFAASLPW